MNKKCKMFQAKATESSSWVSRNVKGTELWAKKTFLKLLVFSHWLCRHLWVCIGEQLCQKNRRQTWILFFNIKNTSPLDFWWCNFLVCWLACIISRMHCKWKLALYFRLTANLSKSTLIYSFEKADIERDCIYLSIRVELCSQHSLCPRLMLLFHYGLHWARNSLTWASCPSHSPLSLFVWFLCPSRSARWWPAISRWVFGNPPGCPDGSSNRHDTMSCWNIYSAAPAYLNVEAFNYRTSNNFKPRVAKSSVRPWFRTSSLCFRLIETNTEAGLFMICQGYAQIQII